MDSLAGVLLSLPLYFFKQNLCYDSIKLSSYFWRKGTFFLKGTTEETASISLNSNQVPLCPLRPSAVVHCFMLSSLFCWFLCIQLFPLHLYLSFCPPEPLFQIMVTRTPLYFHMCVSDCACTLVYYASLEETN